MPVSLSPTQRTTRALSPEPCSSNWPRPATCSRSDQGTHKPKQPSVLSWHPRPKHSLWLMAVKDVAAGVGSAHEHRSRDQDHNSSRQRRWRKLAGPWIPRTPADDLAMAWGETPWYPGPPCPRRNGPERPIEPVVLSTPSGPPWRPWAHIDFSEALRILRHHLGSSAGQRRGRHASTGLPSALLGHVTGQTQAQAGWQFPKRSCPGIVEELPSQRQSGPMRTIRTRKIALWRADELVVRNMELSLLG